MVMVVDNKKEEENSWKKKDNKNNDDNVLKQMSPSEWGIIFLLSYLKFILN